MTGTPAAPRRVLVSAAAGRALGAAVGVRDGAVEVVTLERARADASLTVHAAFISRDITGASTKTRLEPVLLATYEVLRRSPELLWVHTHSAGSDRPIYAELRARGVAVTTSSGANATIVAQTALAGVLALARRLPHLMADQRAHRWAPLTGERTPPDLEGQTAVLVGWGPIAQRLQPWLAMLGLHVVVVRRSAAPAGAGIETVGVASLPAALARADWLILACPLTPATRRLIDAAALRALKRGASLVNVARGEVVDEAALVAALESGQVGAAFLDVFEFEPLDPASPLWDLPQVLVTPHSAGHAGGNAGRVEAIFLDNLERWLHGRPLRHAVA